MISAPPVAGATPRPPWKPMKGERLWPTIAARAATTWATMSPPMAMINSTATDALATSSKPETAAQRKPTARETLAPPVRPLPTVRGSRPPISRGTMIPNGIPPSKKPATRATATLTRSMVCIAGKYKSANPILPASGGAGLRPLARPVALPARLAPPDGQEADGEGQEQEKLQRHVRLGRAIAAAAGRGGRRRDRG